MKPAMANSCWVSISKREHALKADGYYLYGLQTFRLTNIHLMNMRLKSATSIAGKVMAHRGAEDALLLSQLPLQPGQLLSSLHSFRLAHMHVCYWVDLRQLPAVVLFHALQRNTRLFKGLPLPCPSCQQCPGVLRLRAGGEAPTLTVARVSLRISGGRRSGGTLTRSVDIAVTRLSGTGSTCISAAPSFPAGSGFAPAPAQAEPQHRS